MSSPKLPASTADLRAHLGLARNYYRIRLVAVAFGFVAVASVLWQNAMPPWTWIGPALHFLVLPHVAQWMQLRSRRPDEFERRERLGAHFLGGLWTALMAFNFLPSVLIALLMGLQSIAGGGRRLLAQGLAIHGLGMTIGVAIFGWHWQPESSLPTMIACLPLLLLQPILLNIAARRAITELRESRLELEHRSQRDGLSGLFNRAHWEGLVRGEFARFRRHAGPAVLVLADLDHFKRINDVHGHAAGDEAIRRFAASLRRVLRETDVCGRYGGEEFGCLLPLTTAAAARDVVERLRHDLHEHPLLDGVMVTSSFGVVELTADVISVEAWLRLADQMLYRAKHLGRDRVVVLGQESASGWAPLEEKPARPTYYTLAKLGHPQKLSQLLRGLDMAELPIALFDPSDRLTAANPAFLTLFAVQPDAVDFADIMRHCFSNQVGPRISASDIDAWLRAADGKRRSQPQRSFMVDTCDGRWFRALETSYSDGWVMVLLFEVTIIPPR